MPAKNTGSTVQLARRLAEPYAKALGLRLWDVLYIKEGASWILRYIIDKDGGVTIEDCEALSRAVNDPLDEADFIRDAYYLEVSSPGLCRELKRPAHFAAMAGQPVRVLLIRPREQGREFFGLLDGYDGHTLTLRDGEETLTFQKGEWAQVTLCDDVEDEEDTDLTDGAED